MTIANIGLTGAGGRLGRTILHHMSTEQLPRMRGQSIPRQVLTSVPQLIRHFEETRPAVIINAAAINQGSIQDMREVNIEVPIRLAEAAKTLRIPFLHLSTTAAHIDNLCEVRTPYAETKKQAKKQLDSFDNKVIFNIDALIGAGPESDQIDISSLALGQTPLKMRLGSSQIVQMTTYDAASRAIINVAREMIDQPSSVPSEIDIAGDPILLEEFIDLVKTQRTFLKDLGLEVHIPMEKLFDLAQLINNGSLSPEFIHLGLLSSENPKVHDNNLFKHFHGAPIPTHEELAREVQKTGMTDTMRKIANALKSNPAKMKLVAEAFKIWDVASFRMSYATSPLEPPSQKRIELQVLNKRSFLDL